MNDLEFVHITKTAGTSIEDWGHRNKILWSYRKRKHFEKYSHHCLNVSVSKWHIPPIYFLDNPYKNKRTFAVVRNPYSRIISEYYCPWTGSKNKHKGDKAEFNEWIIHMINRKNIVSGLPQYLYLPVDYIIRFETLQTDFTNLIQKFNIDIDTKLPHANKSTESNERFTLNDMYVKTINQINIKYKKDFEIFNYEML